MLDVMRLSRIRAELAGEFSLAKSVGKAGKNDNTSPAALSNVRADIRGACSCVRPQAVPKSAFHIIRRLLRDETTDLRRLAKPRHRVHSGSAIIPGRGQFAFHRRTRSFRSVGRRMA